MSTTSDTTTGSTEENYLRHWQPGWCFILRSTQCEANNAPNLRDCSYPATKVSIPALSCTKFHAPMDFIDKNIQDYCEQHTTAESTTLAKLNRDTHANVLQPRMLSGHLQGRLLSMLSHMIKPTSILEIGTYTGYSAICLAEGLREGGKLITIDVNPELEDRIRKYIDEAGLSESISFIVGDAKTIIRSLPNRYDLVFVDADKASYPLYYELALERLLPGGYIIFDNVLWSGKVVDEKQREKDRETKVLHDLNEQIQNDKRVENVLLPVRDGLMILRKL